MLVLFVWLGRAAVRGFRVAGTSAARTAGEAAAVRG
jgi:hypothetical protein